MNEPFNHTGKNTGGTSCFSKMHLNCTVATHWLGLYPRRLQSSLKRMQSPTDYPTFSINISTALNLKYAMIPSFHQQTPNSEFIKRKTSNIQHHKKKRANI
jgi:hypothetical protein